MGLMRPRWTLKTPGALTPGPRRYSELVHLLTIASGETVHSRSLTDTLRHLQDNGIVEHQVADDDGAVYRLTTEGHELVEVLDDIANWTERHPRTIDL